MHRWLKLALVAVTAVVVTQLLVRGADPALEAGAAPPLALPDLEGRRVDLASLRGKVVAVNFWASWCGPCLEEIPELAEVWTAHKDRCFELLGVAEESAIGDVRRAAARIPYPILLDERAEALGPWKIQGYPRTYLVDADGKVRRAFQGALSRRQLEDAIAPLLPADCPSRS